MAAAVHACRATPAAGQAPAPPASLPERAPASCCCDLNNAADRYGAQEPIVVAHSDRNSALHCGAASLRASPLSSERLVRGRSNGAAEACAVRVHFHTKYARRYAPGVTAISAAFLDSRSQPAPLNTARLRLHACLRGVAPSNRSAPLLRPQALLPTARADPKAVRGVKSRCSLVLFGRCHG